MTNRHTIKNIFQKSLHFEGGGGQGQFGKSFHFDLFFWDASLIAMNKELFCKTTELFCLVLGNEKQKTLVTSSELHLDFLINLLNTGDRNKPIYF